jgi:hypothetical protein
MTKFAKIDVYVTGHGVLLIRDQELASNFLPLAITVNTHQNRNFNHVVGHCSLPKS